MIDLEKTLQEFGKAVADAAAPLPGQKELPLPCAVDGIDDPRRPPRGAPGRKEKQWLAG